MLWKSRTVPTICGPLHPGFLACRMGVHKVISILEGKFVRYVEILGSPMQGVFTDWSDTIYHVAHSMLQLFSQHIVYRTLSCKWPKAWRTSWFNTFLFQPFWFICWIPDSTSDHVDCMAGPTVAVSLAAGVYVCLHNGLLVMYFYWLYTDLYPVYYGLS